MIVKQQTLRHKMLRWFLYLILGIFVIYYIFPLYVMISTSLKDISEVRQGNILQMPKEISFWAWKTAWNGLDSFFWSSVRLTVPAVIISTLIGAINGYVLSKWRFKGSEIIFGALLFGSFIPLQIVILPMSQILGQAGLSGTTMGLIIAHVVYGISFTTLFFRNYFVSIPNELVRAATIDGATFWQIFWKIFLPLSLPVMTVTVIWQFTNIWNDFLFAISFALGGDAPITVGLNNMVNTTSTVKYYNKDMAAAIIAGLPTLVVYILAGKYFVRGLTAGSVKG